MSVFKTRDKAMSYLERCKSANCPVVCIRGRKYMSKIKDEHLVEFIQDLLCTSASLDENSKH